MCLGRLFRYRLLDWRLSRFSTTEHTEHTETNPPTFMSSFRVFGLFGGSLPCGLIGFTTDGQSPEHRAEFRVRA